jgi:hypothetical protein
MPRPLLPMLPGAVACSGMPAEWRPEVVRGRRRAISCKSVMSASVKPRLAGRQPSNRGGVPRVMTRL